MNRILRRIYSPERVQELLGALVAELGPPLQIQLPNLRVAYIESGVAPNLLISADIENAGDADTRINCWVVAQLTWQGGSAFRFAICPPLQAGGHANVLFPVIEEVPEKVLANVCVTVDPPTPEHPGGLIWESNELDNTTCTGFYTSLIVPVEPPPDLPGQPDLNRIPPEDPGWGKAQS